MNSTVTRTFTCLVVKRYYCCEEVPDSNEPRKVSGERKKERESRCGLCWWQYSGESKHKHLIRIHAELSFCCEMGPLRKWNQGRGGGRVNDQQLEALRRTFNILHDVDVNVKRRLFTTMAPSFISFCQNKNGEKRRFEALSNVPWGI